jgi:hypothetical protein
MTWLVHVGFAPQSGLSTALETCPLWADAVEKGKNEPIKIFACTPVEISFS